jgi:amidase
LHPLLFFGVERATDIKTGTGFDRTVYIGSPLCIQVVAPKLQEEKLVEAMSFIDAALRAEQPLSAKL